MIWEIRNATGLVKGRSWVASEWAACELPDGATRGASTPQQLRAWPRARLQWRGPAAAAARVATMPLQWWVDARRRPSAPVSVSALPHLTTWPPAPGSLPWRRPPRRLLDHPPSGWAASSGLAAAPVLAQVASAHCTAQGCKRPHHRAAGRQAGNDCPAAVGHPPLPIRACAWPCQELHWQGFPDIPISQFFPSGGLTAMQVCK